MYPQSHRYYPRWRSDDRDAVSPPAHNYSYPWTWSYSADENDTEPHSRPFFQDHHHDRCHRPDVLYPDIASSGAQIGRPHNDYRSTTRDTDLGCHRSHYRGDLPTMPHGYLHTQNYSDRGLLGHQSQLNGRDHDLGTDLYPDEFSREHPTETRYHGRLRTGGRPRRGSYSYGRADMDTDVDRSIVGRRRRRARGSRWAPDFYGAGNNRLLGGIRWAGDYGCDYDDYDDYDEYYYGDGSGGDYYYYYYHCYDDEPVDFATVHSGGDLPVYPPGHHHDDRARNRHRGQPDGLRDEDWRLSRRYRSRWLGEYGDY